MRLQSEGFNCWFDKWSLIPGNPWDEAIEEALNDCEVCVVFFGPNGLGPWHREEMRTAIRRRVNERNRHFRVLPVILPGALRLAESHLPVFLQGTTWVEFRQSLDEADAFARLCCGIRGQPPHYRKSGFVPLEGGCPYVGLKTFRQEDARLFFGREALVQQALTRLRHRFGTPLEHRFLAVIGASGSGKSSLVAAGLVPAIIGHEELPDGKNWICVQLRPGANPWESLQVAVASQRRLAGHLAAVDAIAKDEELQSHRLHLLGRVALHDETENCRLVVFVDQFEEFFTLYRQDQDKDGRMAVTRRLFLDNLLYPATSRDSRVLVVVAMRADFYDHCAGDAGLRVAVSENQILVGPMIAGQLREAIVRPAECCGYEIEPPLVDWLLREMERQPEALPFLQHALFRLWEAREGRRLTVAAYAQMGSLEGALNSHAEAVYDSLPSDADRALARSVLLDLVQLNEGTSYSKRPKRLDQLADGNTAKLHPFIARLANAHLVITDQIDGHTRVELPHEALIRGWRRFREWIEESRELLRQKDRIEHAAGEWNQHGRNEDFLFRGSQLAALESVIADHPIALPQIGKDFLDASLELRARELKEMEESQRRQVEHDRLQAELQAAEERMRMDRKMMETQKLESLGILAGGIAHDFNNLLTAILGHANLSMLEIPADSNVRENLKHIELASLRAADLAKQMLMYAGRGRYIVNPVDISALVEEVTSLLQVSIAKKVTLRMKLAMNLPAVMADVSQIRQIVMNLVINASEAIGDCGGTISITTGLITVEKDSLRGFFVGQPLLEGEHVFLEVVDTGCGMSQETIQRICDPFFTTKFAGRGLGLAAVSGIVRSHEGALYVASEEGLGATFRLLLPAVDLPAETGREEYDVAASWKGEGRVLVVDDEHAVRHVLAGMLSSLGFDVLIAENGKECLTMCSTLGKKSLQMILLDLTMPVMDGHATFCELRKEHPDMPVLLMSGCAEEDAFERFEWSGLAGFIQKPFRLEQLKDKIYHVLHA